MTDILDQRAEDVAGDVAEDTRDHVRDNRLGWLRSAWSDDYLISVRGRYWCAVFRHHVPGDFSVFPAQTVMADSAEDLDQALAGQCDDVALFWDRLVMREALRRKRAPGVDAA
jgi:hypothetical protein